MAVRAAMLDGLETVSDGKTGERAVSAGAEAVEILLKMDISGRIPSEQ